MPLVRSVGDIPSQIDREANNPTIEQGAGDGTEMSGHPGRKPNTRLQAHREAQRQNSMEDVRIRSIVDESLRGFREEVINMLEGGFQNLLSQGSIRQEGPNRHREPTNMNYVEREEIDARSITSRNDRQGGINQNARIMAEDINKNSERTLNIIRSWRIRFTGDTSEVSVDEFIYRVNTLAEANLRGNFNLLCEHAHMLFEGKALKWFWRFHRNSVNIDWEELCEALRRQYKDFDTDYDIKDDILRRKQRQNETFDEYYDAIMVLSDRLRTPLTDFELCETIQRNLRPEVRHELLHLEITRVAQLRRAVRKHEKFVKDMTVPNLNKRLGQKGFVTELVDDELERKNDLLDSDTEVCLVVRSGKCWNCDKEGHSFINCLEPRTIFCYGCGEKNVYKPKCLNCTQQRGNFLMDVRAKKDGHPKQI